MKPIILTVAMCIACGISVTTHAEISGYVKEHYYNGGLYTFISTYNSDHPDDENWEYICSNSFEDMDLGFADITLEFDWDSEDERDGYSYVNDCDVVNRMCARGKYIYSFTNGLNETEYACKDCPTGPNGTKADSFSSWDYWDGMGAITDCFIPTTTKFTDDTGTWQYSQRCYYKK